ncbi:hypothetical protein [Actinoalloteichus hymeniacidonis]|nr:hypothetical protein [Actinoalloteichus hymeniacidonis]MBB5910423.1 hypothetical protein [Actinoalloteichus hymeniacidonis]
MLERVIGRVNALPSIDPQGSALLDERSLEFLRYRVLCQLQQ